MRSDGLRVPHVKELLPLRRPSRASLVVVVATARAPIRLDHLFQHVEAIRHVLKDRLHVVEDGHKYTVSQIKWDSKFNVNSITFIKSDCNFSQNIAQQNL